MRRLLLYVLVAPLLAPALTACQRAPSKEQQAELLAALDAAIADAEALEAKRTAGVEAFAAQPSIETQPCTSPVMLGYDMRAKDNMGTPSQGDKYFTVVEAADELTGSVGYRVEKIREESERLRGQVTHDKALLDKHGVSPYGPENVDLAAKQIAEFADHEWIRYEIYYIDQVLAEDFEVEGKRYPSHARGRAFVWDYTTSEVVCAAQLEDQLGATIEVSYWENKGSPDADDFEFAYRRRLRNELEFNVMKAMGLGEAHEDYSSSSG